MLDQSTAKSRQLGRFLSIWMRTLRLTAPINPRPRGGIFCHPQTTQLACGVHSTFAAGCVLVVGP